VELHNKTGASNEDKELAKLITRRVEEFAEEVSQLDTVTKLINDLKGFRGASDDKKKAAYKVITDKPEYKTAFDKLLVKLEEKKKAIEKKKDEQQQEKDPKK